MVKWNKVKDRHCFGECELGDIWIRLNKANQVTGAYLMWVCEKLVPDTVEELKLEIMQLRVEILVENMLKK